jgi:hypothetical protein
LIYIYIYIFLKKYNSQLKKEEEYGTLSLYKCDRRELGRGNGNVAQRGFGSNPICHMVGIELDTFVNFPSFSKGRWGRFANLE